MTKKRGGVHVVLHDRGGEEETNEGGCNYEKLI